MINIHGKDKGVSLRTIHFWLIIGAVVISALMLYFTIYLSRSFRRLAETTEQQIELRKSARELMDASDYLTEKVQRFTVDGDPRFLKEYFEEVFATNHREKALGKMEALDGKSLALVSLRKAMADSVELMDQDFYAMRLVLEAKGYPDGTPEWFSEVPEVLRGIELRAEDAALTPEEKLRRATELVLSDAYYVKKDEIRASMRESLDELERMAYESDASALARLKDKMVLVRVVIVLQTLGIIIMVWLTLRLGIFPVLNAVDRIRADSPIQEVGANEFRYMARAYNKMYDVYKSSLEHLNFKASHDELTGAYNRAGYELLLSGLEMATTSLILFDLDDFKSVNDSYGHETGDRVLQKTVRVLRHYFRSDDYVCRIGGDEFVVFLVHSEGMPSDLIAMKIREINEELMRAEEGVPAVSVSAGIARGSAGEDVRSMFEKADKAMYRAKQSGKKWYAFA